VNIISPGWILVERHEKDSQELKDGYLAGLPMKRWGVPKEIADTVLFLSSDEASYISGQNIAVNGAHTLG
jgi:3-oxoacyl-[acyl-carrier protein] reductase